MPTMTRLGEGAAVNQATGEIVGRFSATPVAPHICAEFGVDIDKDAVCPFCNNGYRAPEQITMARHVGDGVTYALGCPNCSWICTR